MATRLVMDSSTSTTITARVSGWPSGTGFIRFYIGTTTSDMPYDGYVDVSSMSSCLYTFYGLEPGTPYYVKISPRAATAEQEAMESATTVLMYTEDDEPVRPSDWSWTSSVSKGLAMPYTKSGTTITCKPLTASEWNGFINRIYDFLEYKGVTPSVGASSLYVTKDTRMTAVAVDKARDLIGLMTDSLPASASSGGGITAAYINGLKDSLNSIV